jgi:tRNA(fMet)-specific endonuclease VapC
MSDLTLKCLAKRVEALEKVIATREPNQARKDWRKVVRMFRDSEFMRKVDKECMRAREAEREAARNVGRMILADTDHTSFLKYPDSERGRRMIDRLNSVSASEVIGVAIVTVEERMRGWMAVIAKEKSSLRQVVGYRELAMLFEFYQGLEIVPLDEAAARRFDHLRRRFRRAAQ